MTDYYNESSPTQTEEDGSGATTYDNVVHLIMKSSHLNLFPLRKWKLHETITV